MWRSLSCLGACVLGLVTLAALRPEPPVDDAAPGGPVDVQLRGDVVRVRHHGGVTDVPARATRVCALAFADELLCLGLVPVAVQTDPDGVPSDHLADRLRDSCAVRTAPGSGSPDLFAIAASRPELIVTAAIDRRLVQRLGLIAPTIVLRPAQTMYRENGDLAAIAARLRDLAAILGRGEQAEAFLRDFDRRIAELAARIARGGVSRSIAFVRTHGRDWRLYGHRGGFGGEAVFRALGLAAPANAASDGTTLLDPERLIDFDVDALLVVRDPTPGASQGLRRLLAHRLWRRVTAVREGRVHELQIYRHWVLSGPLGKLRMAEDIVACLSS